MNRILTYDSAINEALFELMEKDDRVFIIGQGVKSPWYVGKTTKGLYDRFGKSRVIDTPVSENAVTGTAVGAAIAGLRPVVIHPRMDFMLYAVDQIVNEAANWHYMFGKAGSVPIVIRPIINRGGEQGAQHSQALHAWFAHVPGLKVVMPASAYDAKGLLISALYDSNPVIYIDDRSLYIESGHVPKGLYKVPLGKAKILQDGDFCTLVAISSAVPIALKAAAQFEKTFSCEVIDLRTIKPLDKTLILQSVKKTGRLIICDTGWKSFGVSAEISAIIAEEGFSWLKAPILRSALPDAPAPASKPLEDAYYAFEKNLVRTSQKMVSL